MDEIFEKFNNSVINNLDTENIKKIMQFLIDHNCEYLEDIVEDYLDLFTIEYDEFVKRFNKLNQKYNNKYLELAGEDMNYLEELLY